MGGVFASKAADIGGVSLDTALVNASKIKKDNEAKLEQLFEEFETIKDGIDQECVSIDEIKKGLGRQRVQAYFHHLGIAIMRPDFMFKLLDNDRNKIVSKKEFIRGCMRLQGSTKPDVMEILVRQQSLDAKLNTILMK